MKNKNTFSYEKISIIIAILVFFTDGCQKLRDFASDKELQARLLNKNVALGNIQTTFDLWEVKEDASASKIENLIQQKRDCEFRINELKSQLTTNTTDKEALLKEIKGLEEAVELLNESIQEITDRSRNSKLLLEQLKHERDSLRKVSSGVVNDTIQNKCNNEIK